MEKKDLITVRDYSYETNTDELGYYNPGLVSAQDYVSNVVSELKGKSRKVSTLMTVSQFADELRNAQYNQEEKEPAKSYVADVNSVKKAV